jgi:hypothetical protein
MHLQNLEKEGFLYDPISERITVCADPGELAPHLD